ncbi:remorin 1.4-like [Phragmites australis]|uniref:remorin 1.4-like n=1 Tax=Phragmites australis TaxID=29695 RepID=UPI002D7975AD|nr:remorin 1.4-like [Phragmites australis]XP_062181885.1 remorin 1.4-like [Phragmites australis]XP_062181886.1 remorin 1.4-like [Phragmites australis]XP_062181887.1 remorin 1.4-like [Phragmites australis]
MRPLDDKECYSYSTNGAVNGWPHRKNPASRPKPTPSKWDDAQKWLVGMSNGRADEIHGGTVKPRISNADDRRLLSSSSQNGRVSCSSVDGALEYSMLAAPPTPPQLGEGDDVGETKKIDCMVQQHGSPVPVFRSVCLRDMGTEMTPIASKEPSRTATPLRASTPVARSPMSSRSSTPARRRQDGPVGVTAVVGTTKPVAVGKVSCGGEEDGAGVAGTAPNTNSLESRAAAWDEAERAKFTARYKREEVKIQAWENHEKRKAETEMKKMQMKADQMKAQAQEKLANRLAATRRMAEEKRASAEAKLNERAARTSEKANYIRRTGHLPSFFNFKMPCLCG